MNQVTDLRKAVKHYIPTLYGDSPKPMEQIVVRDADHTNRDAVDRRAREFV